MIRLPAGLVPTKIPGYFYDPELEELYSLKIGGVLTPLKRVKPTYFNRYLDGWLVSHKGRPRRLTKTYLDSIPLDEREIHVISWGPAKGHIRTGGYHVFTD